MIVISRTQSIYDLVTAHPEVADIMVEIGFKDIIKPGILQSMGKMMTLEKGAKMKKIQMSEIIATFKNRGYELN